MVATYNFGSVYIYTASIYARIRLHKQPDIKEMLL